MRILIPGLSVVLISCPVSAQEVLQTFDGTSVIGLGDLNGDQFGDVAVADAFDVAGGVTGRVRLVSGSTGQVLHELLPPAGTTLFGERVASGGDLTGDGVAECLVWNGRQTETVWAYDGATGQLLHTWGGGSSGPWFGWAMTGIGDADGDGFGDVAVGAPYAFSGAGRVTVFSGATGAVISTRLGEGTTHQGPFATIGFSLAPAGDYNGDGLADVLVGRPAQYFPVSSEDGFLVMSGADGALLFRYNAPNSEYHGLSVGLLGDLDGDGTPDYMTADVIPDGTFGPRAVSGASGQQLVEYSLSPTVAAAYDEELEHFGAPAAVVGDVNGDGRPDVAVSWATRVEGIPTRIRTGYSIYSGSTGDWLFDLLGPGGSLGLDAIAALGDIDGDGFADLGVQVREQTSTAGLFDGALPGVESQAVVRTPSNGRSICLGLANSTGQRATLRSISPSGFSVQANDLTLALTNLPSQAFGLFVVSQEKNVVFFPGGGQGRLCIASTSIGRLPVLMSNNGGAASFSPDLNAVPLNGSPVGVMPGDTFNFQFWFRDASSGGATSNFSGAVGITFN